MLVPKLLTTMKDYSLKQFGSDFTAGIIVGIVALPLAIAFAIASGVTPEKGLYTAIIAGLIISTLGGSRVQIGGPTGAFVVIVAGIIAKYGFDGLTVATIMAGFFLILMGFFKVGALIRYIPYTIITGFTAGIAVIIFSSQVNDFFGFGLKNIPAEFHEKWWLYIKNISHIDPVTFGVGAISLGIIIFWPRINQKIPGSLIAIVAATAAVKLLVNYGIIAPDAVMTIGSKYSIPSSLPIPVLPSVNFSDIKGLINPAFTIALLAAIESLLSAVVADGMIGGKHRSNMELIAQGVANVVTPLFGGIPATGAIARTATNVKNGGRTPVAGIVHAVTLFVILIAFGKYAEWIPLSALAAVLIFVSYNMAGFKVFASIFRGQRSDIIILLVAFLLTVFIDLTVAIEAGLIAAAFLFMKKMSDSSNIKALRDLANDDTEVVDDNSLALRHINPAIQVFEIDGPFFFGTVHKFQEALSLSSASFKAIILRMRDVPYLDADGLVTLSDIHAACEKNKCRFYISDIHTQPLMQVVSTSILQKIGEDHIFGNLDDALERAHADLHLKYDKDSKMHFDPTVAREKK